MISRHLLFALGLSVLPALPAAAAPFCTDDRIGAHMHFEFSMGDHLSQDDVDEFDLMQLRQMGVDATRVERWNGCIRAFVRKPNGVGEEMQFFDPNTFRRVQ